MRSIIGESSSRLATRARKLAKRRGRRETLVIEADEYGKAFLGVEPAVAVITNIELEHVDIYRCGCHNLAEYRPHVAARKPSKIGHV